MSFFHKPIEVSLWWQQQSCLLGGLYVSGRVTYYLNILGTFNSMINDHVPFQVTTFHKSSPLHVYPCLQCHNSWYVFNWYDEKIMTKIYFSKHWTHSQKYLQGLNRMSWLNKLLTFLHVKCHLCAFFNKICMPYIFTQQSLCILKFTF